MIFSEHFLSVENFLEWKCMGVETTAILATISRGITVSYKSSYK
jgi:hypothetical protein